MIIGKLSMIIAVVLGHIAGLYCVPEKAVTWPKLNCTFQILSLYWRGCEICYKIHISFPPSAKYVAALLPGEIRSPNLERITL